MAISYTVSYTFAPSTTISSSQVNQNFTDNSNTWNGIESKSKTFLNLGVDTQLKSAGTIEAANGAVGAPSLTFSSDTATGFYRIGSASIGLSTSSKLTGSVIIVGTTTNDSASTGNVGEWAQGGVARGSAVNLTNATFINITNVSLTAGDWDVTGIGIHTLGGSTITGFQLALSAFTGNTTTDHVQGDNLVSSPTAATSVEDATLTVPVWRVSISGPTTIYIKMRIDASGGNPLGYGRISARRVR